jgi:hypothetical protein
MPTTRYPSKIYPNIPVSEKKRIEEQHDARTGPNPTILSIFMTNAMECGKGAAVFEIAARFNHSCVPNAHFAWSEELGLETVFAVKEIGVDEVMLSRYTLYLEDTDAKYINRKSPSHTATQPTIHQCEDGSSNTTGSNARVPLA